MYVLVIVIFWLHVTIMMPTMFLRNRVSSFFMGFSLLYFSLIIGLCRINPKAIRMFESCVIL